MPAQIPNQTEAQLQTRLEQHMSDRNFHNATLLIYGSGVEFATGIRSDVAERRDAYNWLAALSTGCVFFIGQALPRIRPNVV